MAEEPHGAKGAGAGGGHRRGHGGAMGHSAHAEEGEGGVAEWMISFADNALLQMGFFVILLAITMKQLAGMAPAASSGHAPPAPEAAGETPTRQNMPDFVDAAIALRAAFNNPVRIDSVDPRDVPLIQRLIARQTTGEGQEAGPKGGGQQVQSIRPTDYHALSGAVFFDDGSAELKSEARQTLEDIARRLHGLRLVVEVRGHASAEEAFDQPDRAMRLTFERAAGAAGVLAQSGLAWKQLRLIASGDNDRVQAVAYGKIQQRQNQRVEVVVTNELLTSQP